MPTTLKEKPCKDIEGQKRQHFPYTIVSDCPECGAKTELDLTCEYISYPRFGQKQEVVFYCENEDCEEEWEVVVIPRLTLAFG